ncbi:MAG: nitroreductase [Limosilactobacillus sp.]|uniref:nitroreductase n=1 Tax=Limosilactobacillus sp. TaxID=2773925 RepID=UPI0027071715|nr:nitroreductase [Limosilactobacillus sp.]
MEFDKVIKKRKSVRMFNGDPVDQDLIVQVVEDAMQAPSWVNSQPWQVYCALEETTAIIKQTYHDNDAKGKKPAPELAVMPRDEWADRPRENMKEWGHEIVHHFTDYDEAHAVMSNASNILNATETLLVITVPKKSPEWSLVDAGAFAQTLMLSATNHGLGTLISYNSVRYADDLREILHIPDDERIVVGIEIGYPENDKINSFKSQRQPLENVLHFKK